MKFTLQLVALMLSIGLVQPAMSQGPSMMSTSTQNNPTITACEKVWSAATPDRSVFTRSSQVSEGSDRSNLPDNTNLTKFGITPEFENQGKKGNAPQNQPLTSNVSVFLLVNQGPMGELYTPFDFDGGLKITERETDYVFPSLYFDVSASPLYVPVNDSDDPITDYAALGRLKSETKDDKNGIQKITNRGMDMSWMNVAIELQPVCESTEKKPVKCESGYPLGILEVLPNESRSGLKDSAPVQIAKAFEELGGLTEPFFPASTFDLKAAAGTKGLSVIFRNLFPPKVVTYMHAHIDTLHKFGWSFREDRTSDNSTLLGLHRGIVLLQTEERVKGILVKYTILSEWNKRPNNYSEKFDLRQRSICMVLPQAKEPAPPKYPKLTSLDGFPFLLPKSEVCKLMQIELNGACDETKFEDLATELGISPKVEFVKRTLLETHLGLRKKK